MTIKWLTDPHLDRSDSDSSRGLMDTLSTLEESELLVTGDVSNASRLSADLKAMGEAFSGKIYFVLGNHDHYGSSVGVVRDEVTELARVHPNIQWLPPAGVVELADGRALVGVDGWADGRHGDPLKTPLVLNDDRLIAELAEQDGRLGKLTVKRVLAKADAERLAQLLRRAIAAGHRQILVATHIPPFVAALKDGSREAHINWHPLLICGSTGAVLRSIARNNPAVEIQVLAGHSHRASEAVILPNLSVRVGAARYGNPSLGLDSA